jgi:dihydrofolate reductase
MTPRPGAPPVALIAAVAANGVIGRDNRLPWRLPADLRRFKELTMGHALVMGRRTYESIGRPLPGRVTVVLTRDPAFMAPPGALAARSLEEALAAAAAATPGAGEVFVAGGAEVYAQALPRADRLYLTRVEAEVEGDARFPDLDPARWRLAAAERLDLGPPSCRFEVWERI